MKVRACIFDLGGTIVDCYSITPLKSLIETFKHHDININNDLIFKDIGIDKKIRIANILEDKYVYRNWFQKYKRSPDYNDVLKLHETFKIIQTEKSKNIDIIPETYSTFEYLKKKDIKIGCTTGFDKNNANIIGRVLNNNICKVDNIVSSTCVEKNRPHSDMIHKNMIHKNMIHKNMIHKNMIHKNMIHKNMINLGVLDPRTIIKIDDTNIGITEGKNAGLWTVGVARWSTYMNVLPQNINNMNDVVIRERLESSKEKLKLSDPDFIIETLDELPNIVETINIHNSDMMYF
jgi:phosphonoacetaldehyde hydrolase